MRLHSSERKIQLRSQCRLEALKSRRECNRVFWKFAGKVLDGESEHSLMLKKAEEYFRRVYSSVPRSFTQPQWLPSSPLPSEEFNTDPISIDEIARVIKRTKSKSPQVPWIE